MATDDLSLRTVEIRPDGNGRLRYPAPDRSNREKVTVELHRPACPDRTMELAEGDLEVVLPPRPPPPPTLRAALPAPVVEDDFLPLAACAPPLGDPEGLDVAPRGLEGFLRRLLFRLGWLRFDDDPGPLPLEPPSRWPLGRATGALRG